MMMHTATMSRNGKLREGHDEPRRQDTRRQTTSQNRKQRECYHGAETANNAKATEPIRLTRRTLLRSQYGKVRDGYRAEIAEKATATNRPKGNKQDGMRIHDRSHDRQAYGGWGPYYDRFCRSGAREKRST